MRIPFLRIYPRSCYPAPSHTTASYVPLFDSQSSIPPPSSSINSSSSAHPLQPAFRHYQIALGRATLEQQQSTMHLLPLTQLCPLVEQDKQQRFRTQFLSSDFLSRYCTLISTSPCWYWFSYRSVIAIDLYLFFPYSNCLFTIARWSAHNCWISCWVCPYYSSASRECDQSTYIAATFLFPCLCRS